MRRDCNERHERNTEPQHATTGRSKGIAFKTNYKSYSCSLGMNLHLYTSDPLVLGIVSAVSAFSIAILLVGGEPQRSSSLELDLLIPEAHFSSLASRGVSRVLARSSVSFQLAFR